MRLKNTDRDSSNVIFVVCGVSDGVWLFTIIDSLILSSFTGVGLITSAAFGKSLFFTFSISAIDIPLIEDSLLSLLIAKSTGIAAMIEGSGVDDIAWIAVLGLGVCVDMVFVAVITEFLLFFTSLSDGWGWPKN